VRRSAVATTVCGRHHRQGARPQPRRHPHRRPRVGSAASGRNGGFMESSLTHGTANGRSASPTNCRCSRSWALKNLNDIESAIQRYNIDCDYERTGVIDIATKFHSPSATSTSCATTTCSCARWARRSSGSTPGGMRAQVNSPTYTGRPVAQGPCRHRRPGPPGLGLKTAAMSLGVRIYEDTKATVHREGRRRRARHHAARPHPCRQGGAGHQRVQAAAEADQPLHRPGVRLLHGHRAALQRAARRDRVDQPPGPQRHQQPVPLLPTHRGQPDPVGRLRRHLLLARQGEHRAREPARDVGQAEQALLRHLPAAGGPQVHPHVGRRHRHLQPLLRVLGQRHGRAAWPTRRLHRPRCGVHPLRRRGDARHARRQAFEGHRDRVREERSHCRSRPSRSASSASRPRATRSTARTRPASATCGCAASTASASASTRDPVPR
jgi:hypothetical protein